MQIVEESVQRLVLVNRFRLADRAAMVAAGLLIAGIGLLPLLAGQLVILLLLCTGLIGGVLVVGGLIGGSGPGLRRLIFDRATGDLVAEYEEWGRPPRRRSWPLSAVADVYLEPESEGDPTKGLPVLRLDGGEELRLPYSGMQLRRRDRRTVARVRAYLGLPPLPDAP